jgi:hypothetical protein
MPWERFIRVTFGRYNDSLEKAIDRNVKIRFILDKPLQKIEAHTSQQKKLMKAFEIKYIPQITKTVCAIFDQKESYVLTNPTVDLKEVSFFGLIIKVLLHCFKTTLTGYGRMLSNPVIRLPFIVLLLRKDLLLKACPVFDQL